jgi:hypothetical protein
MRPLVEWTKKGQWHTSVQLELQNKGVGHTVSRTYKTEARRDTERDIQVRCRLRESGWRKDDDGGLV